MLMEATATMELTFECPGCGAVGHASPVESIPSVSCRSCSRERPLHAGAFDEGGALRSCPWCATEDLYIQKDFPQALGLLIVVVGFVISTVFWYYEDPLPAYAVLLASALLDMALYYRVPDVTICYRCLGQYRGEGSNVGGRFRPFDLAVGERYRQERMRAEQLRARRPVTDVPPGP
jgi:hypothetical protein